jgi:hypothetical protein
MGGRVDRRQVPAAIRAGDALNDGEGIRRRLSGGAKRRYRRGESDAGFEETIHGFGPGSIVGRLGSGSAGAAAA